jgi:hypothetical protein
MGVQIKLRWNNTVSVTHEATVDVDDLPDDLIEHLDGNEWTIAYGDVDSAEVNEFLENLETPVSTTSYMTESRYVEEDYDLDVEVTPPPAPPVRTGPISVEVAEYISLVEAETEMLTPYNADEVIDLADETRKERA